MKKRSLFGDSMMLALNTLALAVFVTGIVFTLLTYGQADGIAYYTSFGSQAILTVYFSARALKSLLNVRGEIKRINNEKLDNELIKRAAELVKTENAKEENKAQA
jgi:hypothetical protein